jgi:hypothetical protein
MINISGFDSQINLVADITFPFGIVLTQYADDADPFDIPSVQIADRTMGTNGDFATWATPNYIPITLSFFPTTEDDRNMKILFDANFPTRGQFNSRDVITLTCVYPNGSIVTLSDGVMTDGMPGNSISSSKGRLKTNTYGFSFAKISRGF